MIFSESPSLHCRGRILQGTVKKKVGMRNEPIFLLKEEIHLEARIRCVMVTALSFTFHSGIQLWPEFPTKQPQLCQWTARLTDWLEFVWWWRDGMLQSLEPHFPGLSLAAFRAISCIIRRPVAHLFCYNLPAPCSQQCISKVRSIAFLILFLQKCQEICQVVTWCVG